MLGRRLTQSIVLGHQLSYGEYGALAICIHQHAVLSKLAALWEEEEEDKLTLDSTFSTHIWSRQRFEAKRLLIAASVASSGSSNASLDFGSQKIRWLRMVATPVHLVDREVCLTRATEEIMTMTPQFPIDLTPRLEFLKELHHIHIEIPIGVPYMVANELTPSVEPYIAGYAVHVRLHGVGHTATATNATKQTGNAVEMSAQHFRIRFTKTLYKLCPETRCNALLLIPDHFQFEICEHCRQSTDEGIIETCEIR